MIKTFLFILLSSISFSALAAEKAAPLEITADKALEWNQADKTYVARGNALAKQGDLSVKADTLTATYEGADKSTSDIILLTAEGHVTLSTATDTATGDKAVYDLKTGKAVLSGARPKVVQNGKNTLEADEINVWTVNNAIDRAEANGKVSITDGAQTATGDKATYTASTNVAELIGNVKITQGKNIIEGDKAEMNLTTRMNKIIGKGGKESGRVKAVFYTDSKKETK